MEFLSAFWAQYTAQMQALTVMSLFQLLSIVGIDIALSGDNALIIRMYANKLEGWRQNAALFLGILGAVVLRIVALCCAAALIANVWVLVLGALYLIGISIKHFATSKKDADVDVGPSIFWVAVYISWLDLVMSADNVVAIVGMTQNIALITIGVALSLLVLVVTIYFAGTILEHYPTLTHGAYVVLLWIGGVMLVEHGGIGLAQILAMADYVVYLGPEVHNFAQAVEKLHYDVPDIGVFLGIALILGGSVWLDMQQPIASRG